MDEVTIDLDDAGTGATVNLDQLVERLEVAIDDLPEEHGTESAQVELIGAAVPIFFALAIAATYCMKYYFSWREKQGVQQMVRTALERGDPLTRDLLDRLVQEPPPKRNDLRRGMIALSLGVALGAFGFISGEPDAVRPMLAIGLVPVLLGIAYLLLWRLEQGRNGSRS